MFIMALLEVAKTQEAKIISITLKLETHRSPLPLALIAFNGSLPLQVLRNHKYIKDLEDLRLALNVNSLNKMKDNKKKERTLSFLLRDLSGTGELSINNKERYCPVLVPGTNRISIANIVLKSQSFFLNKALEREAPIM